MIHIINENQYNFFQYDKCDQCGDCYNKCIYLKLSKEKAIKEKEKMLCGRGSKVVLNKCRNCFACNVFCTNKAHPYELILHYCYKLFEKKGVPSRALYFMPLKNPNFRTYVTQYFPEYYKKMIHKWEYADPTGKKVLYPGCNVITLPHLVEGPFLEEVDICGNMNLCCGEMYYRMGIFSKVSQIAAKLSNYYRKYTPKKMYFICPSCYNMFLNILPNQFGAQFHFEKELLTDWIIEKINKGRLEIKNSINKEITIHDSCHGRILGSNVMDGYRELLIMLGAHITEMKQNRENGYCCGVASITMSNYSVMSYLKNSILPLKEANQTKASELAVYCGGCLISLSIRNLISPSGLSIFHILEYVQRATGILPDSLNKKVAKNMLLGILKYALPKYLSPYRTKNV